MNKAIKDKLNSLYGSLYIDTDNVKELSINMNKSITTTNQEVININSVFTINGRVDILAKDNFGGIVSIALNKDEVQQLIANLQESIKED